MIKVRCRLCKHLVKNCISYYGCTFTLCFMWNHYPCCLHNRRDITLIPWILNKSRVQKRGGKAVRECVCVCVYWSWRAWGLVQVCRRFTGNYCARVHVCMYCGKCVHIALCVRKYSRHLQYRSRVRTLNNAARRAGRPFFHLLRQVGKKCWWCNVLTQIHYLLPADCASWGNHRLSLSLSHKPLPPVSILPLIT